MYVSMYARTSDSEETTPASFSTSTTVSACTLCVCVCVVVVTYSSSQSTRSLCFIFIHSSIHSINYPSSQSTQSIDVLLYLGRRLEPGRGAGARGDDDAGAPHRLALERVHADVEDGGAGGVRLGEENLGGGG